MQPLRSKPTTKALHPPPLQTIQVTSNEIIFLQAALHHYQFHLRFDQQHYQKTAPLIQQFIERLHAQSPPLTILQATSKEISALRAALEHYQFFVKSDRDLSQATPFQAL